MGEEVENRRTIPSRVIDREKKKRCHPILSKQRKEKGKKIGKGNDKNPLKGVGSLK